ncbi:pentapeptide repeat-containing protein [Rathayibacter tritici]|uniref:Pentapeptide repeat-containing protein n=1 Tax=Rathayibacter tritici TaxID=33888 RepID=A0A160KQR9_9MICO|nr:pentapeptide repeat-containing protein [Rathayibacter tritici]AND15920.1 hypothetical protein A6122_0767 [Rathayibacter tritici]
MNLQDDYRCGVHERLRPLGFKGCTVFDCFGAGQKVSQDTFAGVSWRVDPGSRPSMFEVFSVVRQLHEVLWFVNGARLATLGFEPLAAELTEASARIERLADGSATEIVDIDVDDVRHQVRHLLLAASDHVRAIACRQRGKVRLPGRVRPGADLLGVAFRDTDLRGADLRSSYLIGSDLRGSDLRGADVLGADLRDADVSGADLSEALYLSQTQVNAANGDFSTLLPAGLERPAHWS